MTETHVGKVSLPALSMVRASTTQSFLLPSSPRLPEGTISEIIPNFLYLGDRTGSESETQLLQLGITHIINVTSDIPHSIVSYPPIQYMRIPVDDTFGQNIDDYFHQAIEFIEQARLNNGKVFVHCMAGISRSASIVIAYIIYSHRIDLNSAFRFVSSKRHIISPNLDFMGRLLKFQRSLDII